METSGARAEPILIGGGELGRCRTRVHHDRFSSAAGVTDRVAEHRIAEGRRWEQLVLDRVVGASNVVTISSGLGELGSLDSCSAAVIAPDVEPTEREAATRTLLAADVPIIVGGRIASVGAQAVGAPDLLIRLDDGYAPIDVKHHKVLADQGLPARMATLDDLSNIAGRPAWFRTDRVSDLLQVAHYWRLLDGIGRANPRAMAGIIGSEPSVTCAWVNLNDGSPSISSRHDADLSATVAVVEAGWARPETPLVPPIWRSECRSCPWRDHCRSELEAIDHVSLLPAIRGSDAEAAVAGGFTTTSSVADLDLADSGTHPGISDEAILEARARRAGALLPRAGADVHLPDVSVEIDFDIETYRGELYLAGFLITDDGPEVFDPVADWTGTPDGERRVLADVFRRFDAIAERGDTIVYHWTAYERSILSAAADRHGLSMESAASVDAWFDRHACDLWAWVKQRFVSPAGYSLKVVAPLCGFAWRDGDAGGAQSELWYADQLGENTDQRQRLLDYNEDDVRAQAAIRRWIRSSS